MRIVELEVRHVRGLPEITLRPNEQNVVIWGPNGTGKSSVVDAIDFVLTGRMSRLMGRGTGELSLAGHGAHVDHGVADAYVRAAIKLDQESEAVDVIRRLNAPDQLECPGAERAALAAIQVGARRRQHLLTRRDMLRFISVEGGTRASEVQALLALDDVEATRGALVTARNALRARRQGDEQRKADCQIRVAAAAQIDRFDSEQLMAVVNRSRRVLNSEPMSELSERLLPSDMSEPSRHDGPSVEPSVVAQDVNRVRRASESDVVDDDRELRRLLGNIRDNPALSHALAHLELVEQGMDLLDGSGKCPLCDVQWDADDLATFLTEKRRRGEEAKEHRSLTTALAEKLQTMCRALRANLENLVRVAERLRVDEFTATAAEWRREIEELEAALQTPLESYLDERFPPESVQRLFKPRGLDDDLTSLQAAVNAAHPAPLPNLQHGCSWHGLKVKLST